MFFFTSPGIAMIGPVSFIIINYISYRRHIFASMVLLTSHGPMSKSAGAAAILVLGYGDGLAAEVGNARAEKSRSIPFILQRKTIAGS
jgi:dolichol kinase